LRGVTLPIKALRRKTEALEMDLTAMQKHCDERQFGILKNQLSLVRGVKAKGIKANGRKTRPGCKATAN